MFIDAGVTGTIDTNGDEAAGAYQGSISGPGGLAIVNSSGVNGSTPGMNIAVTTASLAAAQTITPAPRPGARLTYLMLGFAGNGGVNNFNTQHLNPNNTLFLGAHPLASLARVRTPTNQILGSNLNLIANTCSTLILGSNGASGTSALALMGPTGGITRNSGSTLSILPGANDQIYAVNTNVTNNNGIIGGWATYGGTDWAVVGGTSVTVGSTTYHLSCRVAFRELQQRHLGLWPQYHRNQALCSSSTTTSSPGHQQPAVRRQHRGRHRQSVVDFQFQPEHWLRAAASWSLPPWPATPAGRDRRRILDPPGIRRI